MVFQQENSTFWQSIFTIHQHYNSKLENNTRTWNQYYYYYYYDQNIPEYLLVHLFSKSISFDFISSMILSES
jgi:hypothetical protein